MKNIRVIPRMAFLVKSILPFFSPLLFPRSPSASQIWWYGVQLSRFACTRTSFRFKKKMFSFWLIKKKEEKHFDFLLLLEMLSECIRSQRRVDEIFRFQLPQGNRWEKQMEGREENGKTSEGGGRWRKREDRIVVTIERRRKKGKRNTHTCVRTNERTNLRHDGRPRSPMINRSPLLHNRLVISHEYIRLHVQCITACINHPPTGHTLDFPGGKQKTAEAFQQ